MKTETASPRFGDIDLWPTQDSLEAMYEGQLAAAAAVRPALPALAVAADAAALRLSQGQGRLVFAGAGTSGRVAIQDGVELGPTYGWPEERLLFALAGGLGALTRSVENAEDDRDAGCAFIADHGVGAQDVVIGIAASGRTPYTIGAIAAARASGALTIAFSGNPGSPLSAAAEHGLSLETGAEVIAGSTRMKAGTAQKIALNLLSTAIMLRLERVYGGLMVDMRVSNAKLRVRAVQMLRQITRCDEAAAVRALEQSGYHVKTAALITRGLSAEKAAALLVATGGSLRGALAFL